MIEVHWLILSMIELGALLIGWFIGLTMMAFSTVNSMAKDPGWWHTKVDEVRSHYETHRPQPHRD